MKYRETEKFNRWVEYFTDKNNKVTYFNRTQSAIKAYNYDPVRQYHLASVLGSRNMRKYEFLALVVLAQMGFGFGELMKIGIKKVLDGSFRDWDRFMVRIGYFEEK